MDNKLWYLQNLDLFQGIPDEEIMSIANKIVEKKCHKKEVLYTPFETNKYICVLKKGEVTLYHSHQGRKLIIDILKPGAIFGNFGFDESASEHFAEVTEDSYMCFFEMEDFLKIIQAKPEVMLRFMKIMSNRIKDYEHKMKGNLYDAKEKIIHHLEILEDKNRRSLMSRLRPKQIKITHNKLAQQVGLSRETVTRAISDLRKEGRITSDESGSVTLP